MVLAEITDPEGRRVILTRERWDHIVDPIAGHPEIAPYLSVVLAAVGGPTRRRPGRRDGEEWIYLADVGPSRWLKVVVSYHGSRGRIITAFARRSFP